ncbi:MAG: TolC family protein [Desulfosalsimonadaceae bacterium]
MKRLVILPFLFLLGGCAVIHPTDPYPPNPRQPAVASGNVFSGGRPEFPLQAAEGPIGLAEAIEIAYANNPQIAAARWDAVAAKNRYSKASGERLPALGMAGRYARSLNKERVISATGEKEPGAFSRDIVSGDLVLSAPLFAGGRLYHRESAAALLAEESDRRYLRSRQSLAFDVSSVFFDILAQRRVIDALQFSRSTLEKHLFLVDELIAGKKAAPVDRLRTEVRLADIRQQLAKEKDLLDIQQRTLATLLGLPEHMAGISLSGALALERKPAIPEFDEAIESAWKNREDYRAEKAALEARARSVDASRAARWPVVSMEGSYGGRWAAGPASGPGDESGDVGRIGLAMEMPLFQGGRIDADIGEQQAGLAAARERLRGLEHRIMLEIATALSNVRSSEERAEAVRKSIDLARESLRIEQEKYGAGRGTVIDVLDAQGALLDSETTYYRVMAELRTALSRLELAMGDQ